MPSGLAAEHSAAEKQEVLLEQQEVAAVVAAAVEVKEVHLHTHIRNNTHIQMDLPHLPKVATLLLVVVVAVLLFRLFE